MIIYKDVFSDDELLTDTFKIEEVDGIILKVEGKMTTLSNSIDDSLIGGNKSAEGGDDDGVEDGGVSGINIVLNARLNECGMDKKGYQTHIKEYMKRVKSHLEKNQPEEVDTFMKNMAPFIGGLLKSFKDWTFYTGESYNSEAMIIPCKWDGETPTFYFFKHGLVPEKV